MIYFALKDLFIDTFCRPMHIKWDLGFEIERSDIKIY